MGNFPEQEIKIHLYAPYPGTPLYHLALEYGFNPARTFEEWANYDYYEVIIPWINPEWSRLIREFNENYYPYIQKKGW